MISTELNAARTCAKTPVLLWRVLGRFRLLAAILFGQLFG